VAVFLVNQKNRVGPARLGPETAHVVGAGVEQEVAHMFASVAATLGEVGASSPGDEVVPRADVVMDRGFDVDVAPGVVWPWIVQLGKGRAGWYLPRSVERWTPRSRRAAREVLTRWQALAAGDVIPDYGGQDATFEVVEIAPPRHLVYRSRRGHTDVSWAITLTPLAGGGSRVHLRLRLGPVRRVWLAEHVGGAFDALTIAGLAAGLRERLASR
jgi:uncharacterized protein YndB with AHSA1/START domain